MKQVISSVSVTVNNNLCALHVLYSDSVNCKDGVCSISKPDTIGLTEEQSSSIATDAVVNESDSTNVKITEMVKMGWTAEDSKRVCLFVCLFVC